MHLVFGKLWNNDLLLMVDPVDEETARAAYEQGDEIMVAAGRSPLSSVEAGTSDRGEPGEPAAWSLYAELGRGYVEVEFFSALGTREADYGFEKQPDGRLFLVDVGEYSFAQRTAETDDNDWTSVEEHSYQPDGTSSRVLRTRTDVTMEEFTGTDVTHCWEPVPAWGAWESIVRRQR